ncbi:hypothetical protein [Streptomyces sp. NPDC006863]|uniref:hypothetical protein n=1 Tax=Streptomyces sp. NPDC006863 TaxID=3154779 RepID=UPI003404190F
MRRCIFSESKEHLLFGVPQKLQRRAARIYPATILATIMAVSGCATSGKPDEEHEKTAICKGAEFEWNVLTRWRLTVLDKAKIVEPGSKMVADSTPFKPRTAKATPAKGKLTQKTVFANLEKHLGKTLATPGTSTTSEKRIMGARFPKRGQGVYFRGVKQVSGTYTFTCLNKTKQTKGSVFTWETQSSTTGLADCMLGSAGNSTSELSRMAIARRCPEGTPARAILDD